MLEAFEAGDPAQLPSASSAASGREAPASAATEPSPAAPADEDQPRGRDGLTATERETIRAWATDEGIEVKTRGHLRKDLISNYRAWQSLPS